MHLQSSKKQDDRIISLICLANVKKSDASFQIDLSTTRFTQNTSLLSLIIPILHWNEPYLRFIRKAQPLLHRHDTK
jgi:hypothetical protein